MLRCKLIVVAVVFPLFVVGAYAMFLLCTTAPNNVLSMEKAGQFGDSFGVVTCLFSGLAFSGVLFTLYLQREEIKRSEHEHTQNTKLTALAALLAVYHELADEKQKELDSATPKIPNGVDTVGEKLKQELEGIYKTRNDIFCELEKAAGLKPDKALERTALCHQK